MIVLLDTNFITVPAQFKIDIYSEIKEIVPNARIMTLNVVVKELKSLKNKKVSKLALELLKLKKINIIRTTQEGSVDTILLKTAIEKGAVLCTNDAVLKRRCTKNSVPIIFVRGRKNLASRGI